MSDTQPDQPTEVPAPDDADDATEWPEPQPDPEVEPSHPAVEYDPATPGGRSRGIDD
jgi:hypothetical protein